MSGQRDSTTLSGLVGNSVAMENLRLQISQLALRDATALIRGETGTGKELVARCIHTLSSRSAGPFVVVDCAALRDTLLESQLFGHVRGAFTDAHRDTLGALRAADGGVLFLDELGELDLAAQAKLLRCLQERAVVPLGAVNPISINIRVLAATHRDLENMIRNGRFREDLYFRLNVLGIHLPALRERRDDIPFLLRHFLERIAQLYREPAVEFDVPAMAALCVYDWPGNVRELANAAEFVAAASRGGHAGIGDLPPYIRRPGLGVTVPGVTHLIPLEQAQRELVQLALSETQGQVSRAAALLHIERRRLCRLAQRYGLRH